MPIVAFKGIFCCSSEDKNHPATNLLSDANKKWKGESKGLRSVDVTIELKRPTKITGIDIGNEHSAFIQVSVGRNGWPSENYKEILLMSSFMTPMESRNSTTVNRVRCFTKDQLISPVCDEEWDLIKVICTQPFNKHVQYGLSFIKVHAANKDIPRATKPAEEKAKCETLLDLPANNVFAQFKIKDDSSDSDKESSTTLFSKWKQASPGKNNFSTAAAIRDASALNESVTRGTSSSQRMNVSASVKQKEKPLSTSDRKNEESDTKIKIQDRNRDSLMYDDDDINTSKPNLEKYIDKDQERIQRDKNEKKTKKKTEQPKNNRDNSHKMEASASKFKTFLDCDVNGQDNNQVKKATSIIDEKAGSRDTMDKSPQKADVKNRESNHKRLSNSPDKHSAKRIKSDSSIKKTYKPFQRLLEGVVIAISGIQNPERADIRDKALKMGAKYKPDWDGTCTHLICAFKNTPKYNQVKDHGKIVKRSWVIDCFSSRKRLPWRRYALDSNETKTPESEEEILDEACKPVENSETPNKHVDDNEEILALYDLEVKSPNISASGSDSEDGASNNHSQISVKKDVSATPLSIYDADTDEDIENNH